MGEFVTARMLATELNRSERCVRDWAKRGILPCYRMSKRTVLFRRTEIETALRRFRSAGAQVQAVQS